MPKICEHYNCRYRATHNYEGLLPKYCKKHAPENTINVKNKKCEHIGCNLSANFGYEGDRKQYCSTHKLDGMVGSKPPKCKHKDCHKRPSFGWEGGRAVYCGEHKKIGMSCIKSKKCKHANCEISPSYGFEGSIREYCAIHKLEGMILLGNRMCLFEGCKKQARFALDGEKATACGEHKTNEMVSTFIKKKCKFEDCDVVPHYGYENGKAEYCYKHKLATMILLGSRKCKFDGCNKTSAFGFEDGDVEYCNDHKLPTMINKVSVHRICSSCGLRFQTIKKDEEYLCMYCAPTEQLKHKKELKIVKYLKDHCDIDITHDKMSADDTTVCGKYRPDILIELPDRYIIIEIDEEQHKRYDNTCETSRMHQIFEGLGISCIFIRFNPDDYKVGKIRKDPPFEKRMEKLIKTIEKYKNKKIAELQLRIKYLYYDKDKHHKKIKIV